jgi:hypothetical protein
MKIQNAIKKIEKMTGEKVREKNGFYGIIKNGRELSFMKNGGDDSAICFRTRGLNDVDDSNSDYFAGVFWDNCSQAIRAINRK